MDLKYYLGGLLSFTARSISNILDEIYDRITEQGYLLQRGDLEYQTIPEKFLKNLDLPVLEKLLAIDDRLLHLLASYEEGRDPNRLDYLILKDREYHFTIIKMRLAMIENAIAEKSKDPEKVLHKMHRKVVNTPYRNELEKPTVNTRYRDVVLFLSSFNENKTSSNDFYVNSELRTKALEMLSKLEELSTQQLEDRLSKINELKAIFESDL